MDETTITVQEIVRDNRLSQVIELMLAGRTQKDACHETGISERTFSRGVSASPTLLNQFNSIVSSHLAELSDKMVSTHTDVIETLQLEANRLKMFLDLDIDEIPLTIETRIKIAAQLMRIDKYLVMTLQSMYPQSKNKGAPADEPSPGDDAAIAEIFKSMKGANRVRVTLSKEVEVFEETERKKSPGDIIDLGKTEFD